MGRATRRRRAAALVACGAAPATISQPLSGATATVVSRAAAPASSAASSSGAASSASALPASAAPTRTATPPTAPARATATVPTTRAAVAPPPTGNGGNLPGLPNTGAGGESGGGIALGTLLIAGLLALALRVRTRVAKRRPEKPARNPKGAGWQLPPRPPW